MRTSPSRQCPPAASNGWRARRGYAGLLLIFIGFGMLLAIGLTMDPKRIPSPLIGKPVPAFELPPVKGRTLGLSNRNLTGEVQLVNVFASWCVACLSEHPLLVRLAENKVIPVHGLNYKDVPDDAAGWLARRGDPYTRTGADRDGRVGIEWGVYGVPETFVIDRDGRIAHKFIGPLTEKDIDETLMPLIQKLRQQNPRPTP